MLRAITDSENWADAETDGAALSNFQHISGRGQVRAHRLHHHILRSAASPEGCGNVRDDPVLVASPAVDDPAAPRRGGGWRPAGTPLAEAVETRRRSFAVLPRPAPRLGP